MPISPKSGLKRALGVAAVGFLACGEGPLEVNGSPSQSFSVKSGRELEVTLQTIGPGEYVSPPTVSSAAVRFVDVQQVSPPVPAGATQRFRFLAVSQGVAIIVFQHTAQGPTVEDAVEVQ
jgi:hypothetical protein